MNLPVGLTLTFPQVFVRFFNLKQSWHLAYHSLTIYGHFQRGSEIKMSKNA